MTSPAPPQERSSRTESSDAFEGSNHWSLTVFCVLIAATDIVAAWMLGGRARMAPSMIGILAWLGFAWFIFSVFLRQREFNRYRDYYATRHPHLKSPLRSLMIGVLWSLPAWLFVLLLWISILNPAFTYMELADGSAVFRGIEHWTWLPSTVDVERSREMVFMVTGLIALAVAIGMSPLERQHVRTLGLILVFNAVVLALMGTLFRLTGAERLLGTYSAPHYFFATFYYKNHWVAYALISLGIAAGLAHSFLRNPSHDRQGPGRALLCLGAVFLIALTIPLAESRGGMLLLAPFFLVYLFSFLSVLAKRGRRARKLRVPVLVAGIAMIALLVALVAPEIEMRWRDTLHQIERSEDGIPDEIRMSLSPRITAEMALDKPVFGWGYYSYGPVFPLYAPDEWKRPDGTLKQTLEFAHNDWLQHWAEFGFAGMLLLAVWITGYFVRTRPVGSGSFLSAWMVAGIFAVLVHAAWDFPLSNPAVLAHALVTGALAGKIPSVTRTRKA